MLTLFTGMPGAGKTAQMVWEAKKVADTGRPVYSDGINGLTIAHTEIDASRWHVDLPDGALLLVDEAQRKWRPTGPGQKVPEELAAMETHRHRGIDIWFTTQSPKLVHGNLRALVGRHVHLRDTGWLGRWWYEWPECSEQLAWKSCPVKVRHKLPKAAFALYKSASEHIKPQRRIPPLLWVLLAALVLLAGLGYTFVRSLSNKGAPTPAAVEARQPGQTAASGAVMGAAGKPLPAYVGDMTAFTPRMSRYPETAPAFDELRKVLAFPKVVGGFCVGIGKAPPVCKCQTQQGTDAGLSSHECAEWIASPRFDPYRADPPPPSPGDKQKEQGKSDASV